jgi:hypothetical protein
MELSNLKALIAKRNCELLQYEEGKVALVQLPSQEQIIISMGNSSMKIFRKATLFGWWRPKTVLSVDLAAIGWHQCVPLTRNVMSVLLIAKSLDLLTQERSIREVSEKYGNNFNDLLFEAISKEMETNP